MLGPDSRPVTGYAQLHNNNNNNNNNNLTISTAREVHTKQKAEHREEATENLYYNKRINITRIPQIKDPCGVAIAYDGSILVMEEGKKTLHLVSSQGAWTKQLWIMTFINIGDGKDGDDDDNDDNDDDDDDNDDDDDDGGSDSVDGL
ncbi:hypothetical protein PoB_007228100 [Plakobranchus ocellatus]|uniref:Uncharacterized protein n=1 Tax=Plakobranchus ocellatus TaxID=259542 RepID=A0AAV4DPD9_9GAST|nr:hypothetical protein PoB_007228100 [Plakobranchus ocellatus]